MTKQRLKKALDAYKRTGDALALSRSLRELVLYMARDAESGFDMTFLNNLHHIEKPLTSLDLDNIKSSRKKIVDYKVALAGDDLTLRVQVKNAIIKGYQPFGSIAVTVTNIPNSPTHDTIYSQALVKYEA